MQLFYAITVEEKKGKKGQLGRMGRRGNHFEEPLPSDWPLQHPE